MSRNFLVTAVATVSLVAFSASGFAEEVIKGSKSDTSDRMGGGGGAKGAGGVAKTKTVKRSKSNGSERMGGGGGVRSGGGAPAMTKNLNSSRSNKQ